jgi:hypothetical protein
MIQVDYYDQLNNNLPVHKRKTKRIDWLGLQHKPLETLNSNFDVDNQYYDFLARHTGQVLSLTHVLNTLLNPSVPITITDGEVLIDLFIYIDNEAFSVPTYIYLDSESNTPPYIYTDSENINAAYDFYVNISAGDSGLIPQIEALLAYYKAAGKRYLIVQQ